jgi:hypothetical protein
MSRKVKNPGRGYAGLEKIKLYHYDNDGKFLREFESQRELINVYYPNIKGKKPLFRTKRSQYGYDILPDNTFYSNYRVGRNKLLQYEKIINSPFVGFEPTNNKKVIVYDILGEEIAKFKNAYICSKILNIAYGTVFRDCENGKSKKLKDLTFKYAK